MNFAYKFGKAKRFVMHTYLIFLAFGWIRVVIMKIGHLPILWKLFIFLERTRNFSKMSVKYFSIFENLIYFSRLNFDSSLMDKKSVGSAGPGCIGFELGRVGNFLCDLQLWPQIFLQPLDLKECTVPHLKDLIHTYLEPEA